jgi:rod shape-determining protein MreC
VASYGIGVSRPLPGRGASPGFRFTVYAALSIACMFLDQRGGWLERARFGLQAAAYPLQLAVNSPSAAWEWMAETFESRATLQEENAALKQAKRELELRALRFEALARENAQLRGLKEALPPVAERWLPAEVVSVELNSLKQRLLINRGAANGVFKGQSVLTDDGLLGQTTRVGPWSAEIILVTDPEHAVPVQVERTGLRTIAVGAGSGPRAPPELVLPYLPANTDIKEGDLLMTSGLGGVFPVGYPVARVTEVRRGPEQPFAEVHATPLASLDTDREVTLVWFREGHPAAPGPGSPEEIATGNAAMQPQPRPQAAEPLPPPRRETVRAARARAPRTEAPRAFGAPPPATRPDGAPVNGATDEPAPSGAPTQSAPAEAESASPQPEPAPIQAAPSDDAGAPATEPPSEEPAA